VLKYVINADTSVQFYATFPERCMRGSSCFCHQGRSSRLRWWCR